MRAASVSKTHKEENEMKEKFGADGETLEQEVKSLCAFSA